MGPKRPVLVDEVVFGAGRNTDGLRSERDADLRNVYRDGQWLALRATGKAIEAVWRHSGHTEMAM
jgi:hypothetical protein